MHNAPKKTIGFFEEKIIFFNNIEFHHPLADPTLGTKTNLNAMLIVSGKQKQASKVKVSGKQRQGQTKRSPAAPNALNSSSTDAQKLLEPFQGI